jgi:hypothetical protein
MYQFSGSVSDPDPYVFRPSGSVSQRYEDPDPLPDLYQNVTDLENLVYISGSKMLNTDRIRILKTSSGTLVQSVFDFF